MDLDEQLDLARWAVALVERDIHATLPDRPTIEVQPSTYGDGVVIDYQDWVYGVVEFDPSRASALVEVAGIMQVHVSDNWRVWPLCAEHNRGLHATDVADSAVWQCSVGPHEVAHIGHLGA